MFCLNRLVYLRTDMYLSCKSILQRAIDHVLIDETNIRSVRRTTIQCDNVLVSVSSTIFTHSCKHNYKYCT